MWTERLERTKPFTMVQGAHRVRVYLLSGGKGDGECRLGSGSGRIG